MADKPFPKSEAELNLLLQTLVIKLPAYQVALALTVAEMNALVQDALNFDYIITMAQQVSDSKDAFFSFKEQLTNGEPGAPQLATPTFPVINMPENPDPGIRKRLRSLLKRIKSAPGYTPMIGEDLGLIENDPPPFNPNLLDADIKPRAISNGRVEIAFSKQGMNAMRVEYKIKGGPKFLLAGIYTSSPGIHDEPSVPPDTPESREYRGILIRKNAQVGNMSPIYTIVTTP